MGNDKDRRDHLDKKTTPTAILRAGLYVYANPAFLKLLGYQQFSDIEGTSALAMATESDRDRLREHLKLAADTTPDAPSPPSAKLTLLGKDGVALRVKAADTERSISELVNDAVRGSLAEDMEDLAAFEERVDEPNLAFEDVLKELKHSGKI